MHYKTLFCCAVFLGFASINASNRGADELAAHVDSNLNLPQDILAIINQDIADRQKELKKHEQELRVLKKVAQGLRQRTMINVFGVKEWPHKKRFKKSYL